MNKAEIVSSLIKALISQRETLMRELTNIDYNLNGYIDKQSHINSEIANIDMQISNHLMSIE